MRLGPPDFRSEGSLFFFLILLLIAVCIARLVMIGIDIPISYLGKLELLLNL